MKLSLQNKHENQLLERTEVQARVEFEGATPSTAEVAAALASEMKQEAELVVVKHVHNLFGKKEAKVQALVYHNTGAKKKFEVTTAHLIKKAAEAQKANAEAPA